MMCVSAPHETSENGDQSTICNSANGLTWYFQLQVLLSIITAAAAAAAPAAAYYSLLILLLLLLSAHGCADTY